MGGCSLQSFIIIRCRIFVGATFLRYKCSLKTVHWNKTKKNPKKPKQTQNLHSSQKTREAQSWEQMNKQRFVGSKMWRGRGRLPVYSPWRTGKPGQSWDQLAMRTRGMWREWWCTRWTAACSTEQPSLTSWAMPRTDSQENFVTSVPSTILEGESETRKPCETSSHCCQ